MKLEYFAVCLLSLVAFLNPGILHADGFSLSRSESLSPSLAEIAAAPEIQPEETAPTEQSAQALEEYRINPSDLLEISVFQAPELSRTVRVGARGGVTLPLIGQVNAGGLTGRELEELIATKLRESFLQNPQVSVFIKEYTAQRVTVEGSVTRPGVFVVNGKTSLLQAIAMAGGLDRLADTSDIKIFRNRQNGLRESVQYDIELIRKGTAIDPILEAGDMIVVGKSGTRSGIKDVTEVLRDISIFGLFF